MRNVKINTVNPESILPENFMNKSSYKRFMKGFHRAVEMQNLKDEGYIFIIDGEMMSQKENFIFGCYEDDQPCFGTGGESSMSVWLGSSFCDETGRIAVDAYEMDIFKEVSYVSPKNIKKMRKL